MADTSPRPRAAPLARVFLGLSVASALAVLIPFWVIRPFRAQDPGQLQLALLLVRWSPLVTTAAAIGGLPLAVMLWRLGGSRRARVRRMSTLFGAALLVAFAVVARVNVFEKIFHSIGDPSFVPIDRATLGDRDMVLAVRSSTESRAYPVRALTFHHIVNDFSGGEPIAVTYCSLCHTGLVWSRVVDGRVLTFRIGGINNQNMLMRDEETGTFWQQSSGKALAGPLAGRALRAARSDELSFAVWKREAPDGLVLAPVAVDVGDYATADWEARMAERPTVVAPEGLAPRDLVFGLSVNGIDRAIPASLVQGRRVFVDAVGDVPILLLVSADGLAVRAFDARNRGTEIELFAREGATTWIDSGGEVWGFEGCTTVAGERGDCLKPIAVVRSYWFDWRGQHPETTLAKTRE